MATLSEASPYEKNFGTRYRRVGRPEGGGTPEVFTAPDVHPLIRVTAKRRAVAVVMAEQRDRLAEVFKAEVAVLKRRGVKRVAEDVGVKLDLDSGSESGSEG